MEIKLLHNTPLWVCSTAIRKCWASEDKSDTTFYFDYGDFSDEVEFGEHNEYVMGEKDLDLIERIGNKNKHKSTLEHLVYTFDIDGISRACLQELARHRIASYSVKSTRYTLKELKEIPTSVLNPESSDSIFKKFLVCTGDESTDRYSRHALYNLHLNLKAGMSNDWAKYNLPESYKTSLVMTVNARALQNFLELRTSKYALWEIQELARAMYGAIPEEHKYLFKDYIGDN